jgi:drug/metabolite transporter (DMT)-like permease
MEFLAKRFLDKMFSPWMGFWALTVIAGVLYNGINKCKLIGK